ncbi:MAG: leucine-rich repeat domain-containing protein [Oscillospiraceae bacterium]|jgi:hypothetical protein|nr:leucine-rich repeat domain-containing protein [Oscillospiraceae bacterium]
MKERRWFTLGTCAVLITLIILVAQIDRAVNKEEDETPAYTEEEPPASQTEPLAAEPESSVPNVSEYNIEYITIKNMHFPADMSYLDLSDMNLKCEDIIPLKYMVNLTELNLWGDNQIIDISPLSNLTNLTVLLLGGNPVSDITPLENLTELVELRMSDCNVSDLSALSNLTKLRHLTLRNNRISDITPLENLPDLIVLRLNGNSITDWSPVAHVSDVDGRP